MSQPDNEPSPSAPVRYQETCPSADPLPRLPEADHSSPRSTQQTVPHEPRYNYSYLLNYESDNPVLPENWVDLDEPTYTVIVRLITDLWTAVRGFDPTFSHELVMEDCPSQ
jgi:hypothetical protein